MVTMTPSALSKLKALILEHPEDPVVRLTVQDVEETRLAISISLESEPQSDDHVQEHDGVTVAVEGRSAARMDGAILDYVEPKGFTFLHPGHGGDDLLRVISSN